MSTVVLATRNRHKAAELRALLGAGFEFQTLADHPGAPGTVEDAPTFAGNAVKKALELGEWLRTQLPPTSPLLADGALLIVADDSGLEVDALDGAPGVRSARFAADESGAAGNSPDAANNARLLRLLAGRPSEARTARFRCALAAAHNRWESWDYELFEGVCEGRLLEEPRGAHGFGYDPLFVPAGHSLTFAELGEGVKNTISHRAHALGRLRSWLASRGAPGI